MKPDEQLRLHLRDYYFFPVNHSDVWCLWGFQFIAILFDIFCVKFLISLTSFVVIILPSLILLFCDFLFFYFLLNKLISGTGGLTPAASRPLGDGDAIWGEGSDTPDYFYRETAE